MWQRGGNITIPCKKQQSALVRWLAAAATGLCRQLSRAGAVPPRGRGRGPLPSPALAVAARATVQSSNLTATHAPPPPPN